MLKECSLAKLAISFDEYHNHSLFSEKDLIRVLSDQNRKYSIIVRGCSLNGEKNTRIQSLCEQFNADYDVDSIIPFGRADSFREETHVSVFDSPMTCSVVQMPLINTKGVFSVCCGPANGSPIDSPLIINDYMNNCFEAAKDDLIINALFLWGPRYLFNLLSSESQSVVASSKNINSICGLCRAICDNRYIVHELRKKLEINKWVLLCSSELQGD